jgi:hypothetical protein
VVTGEVQNACSTTDTAPAPGQAGATSGADPGTGHLHGLDGRPGRRHSLRRRAPRRLPPLPHRRRTDRRPLPGHDGLHRHRPRTFLAGGHPSPTGPAATSPHLGLIRSTDAGQTWTTVSAAGEADFHSLQQAAPLLYGLDSQTSPTGPARTPALRGSGARNSRPVSSPPTPGRRRRYGRPAATGCCTAPTAAPPSSRFPARRLWPQWNSRLPAG